MGDTTKQIVTSHPRWPQTWRKALSPTRARPQLGALQMLFPHSSINMQELATQSVINKDAYIKRLSMTSCQLWSAERDLVTFTLTNIPFKAFPTGLSLNSGFASLRLLSSWLIRRSVSWQFSSIIAVKHYFFSSSTFTLLAPPCRLSSVLFSLIYEARMPLAIAGWYLKCLQRPNSLRGEFLALTSLWRI